MAHTTSNRQTRIPTPASSLVTPPPNRPKSVSLDAIEAEKERIRLETLARYDIEQEARELRRVRKQAQQEARDADERKKDAARYQEKMDGIQAMIRSMPDKEFRKYKNRVDYFTPEMEEMMRERDGLPVMSKVVKKTDTEKLLAELKSRGALPADYQAPVTTSDSPQMAGVSIDLNDPEENAASEG